MAMAVPTSFDALRHALAALASSTETQLGQHPTNCAQRELTRQYERAHVAAEISHASWVPAELRQVLDELAALMFEGNPLTYADYEVDEDDFLRQSEYWTEVREKARAALDLLERSGA
jgi:hypothetical protein